MLVWGVLPGLVLLHALNVGWSRVESIAGAVGLSVALVAASAYAAELVGLPIAPLPVAALLVGICWLALGVQRRLDRVSARSCPPLPVAFPSPVPTWVPWLVLLVPLVVAFELHPLYTDAILPPTLHDGLDHANWFRLIYETGSLDPREVLAPPLAPDGGPTYYPWGLHGWLALVAHSTTLDPMAVFARCLVAISAALSLSIYVFAAQFMGRGWPALSAAALSLMFWWLPYQVWGWGGYALLTGAVCALPLSRLSLAAVRARQSVWVAAAAVCGVGVLLIHPSQAHGALLVTLVVAVTLAASRLIPWWCPLPFAAALGLGGIAMVLGEAYLTPIEVFFERARSVGTVMAEDPPFRWPLGVYLDYFGGGAGFPMRGRIGLGLLYVAGGVFALFHRAARPLLALHVVLSLLIPLSLYHTWLTTLWYHTPERLWYLQYASLPALAALGIGGLLLLVQRLFGQWTNVTARQAVIWSVVLALFLGGLNLRYFPWVSRRLLLFAHQTLSFTDQRVLADFQWIRDHVPAGETIFNAPADWGLPLPFTGRRTVFFSGGAALDPSTDWFVLLTGLNGLPTRSADAASELRQHGIRYVYAASFDPASMQTQAVPLNTQRLRANPSLDQVYGSATATVFRIRDVQDRHLGIEDSETVSFSGFYAVARDGARAWRWTNGEGRIRVQGLDLEGDECYLRLRGPAPGAYQLRLEDEELDLTALGHGIPRQVIEQDAFELAIHSTTFVPADVGDSTDPRSLGVMVTGIAVRCWGR